MNEVNSDSYNSQEIGLAKALVQIHPGCHVDIVLLSIGCKGDMSSKDILPGITLHVVKARGIGHHGIIAPQIISSFNPELVHILADNMLFAPNIIRYCKKNNINYHLYIGTLFTDNKKWYRQMLDRLMMSRNIRAYRKSRVYVKTPFVQKQCKELGIDAKVVPVGLNQEDTILSAADIAAVRKKYNLPQDKKILLFVGRLEEYKHPLETVEVLQLLKSYSKSDLNNLSSVHIISDRNNTSDARAGMDEKETSDGWSDNTAPDDFILLIIGDGSLQEKIRTRALELELTDKIIHIPQIPNSEMPDIYKACDFYINFNPDEIYGMAILEAMCHKCPVFAMRAPGPEFLIDDGKTGFLCDSVDEMAEKIITCVEDTQMSGRISKSAREKVLSSLIWTETARLFDDI